MLKQSALAQEGETPAVAIVSYDEKPGVQAIGTIQAQWPHDIKSILGNAVLAQHGERPTWGRTIGSTQEEDMTQQSFLDIIRQFGSDLGIPKVDVDKLVETHRKNFEAFTQTVLVASDGVKSLATKQKEMIDTASVALVMARNFKPSGDPQQILAKQSEMARKAFDAAIDHTRQIADQVSGSSAEALKIASDRIVESIAEIRASFEQAGDPSKPKT